MGIFIFLKTQMIIDLTWGNEHDLVEDVDAQTLIKLVKFLNPISTEGGGVFSTSSPVNGSELQNGTNYHLESW